MLGTIQMLNKDRKFGFIKGEDGKEYFFHATALKNCTIVDLEKGDEMEFEDSVSDKGLRAEDVLRV